MGRLLAQCKLICIQKAHAPDHRNRLVRVVDNGKPVEYDYDHQNRLVRRNDELFIHDGWQVACSLKNGRIAHRYLWGAVQDELLAMDDDWALRDHLNTVRKVVNMKGKVVSHLEYNAFGKLVSSTGDKPLFRYTGKMFDDATGLQWNVNRWYDANVGRWISEDPVGFRGIDRNLSKYCYNTPLNAIDYLGRVTNYVYDNGSCSHANDPLPYVEYKKKDVNGEETNATAPHISVGQVGFAMEAKCVVKEFFQCWQIDCTLFGHIYWYVLPPDPQPQGTEWSWSRWKGGFSDDHAVNTEPHSSISHEVWNHELHHYVGAQKSLEITEANMGFLENSPWCESDIAIIRGCTEDAVKKMWEKYREYADAFDADYGAKMVSVGDYPPQSSYELPKNGTHDDFWAGFRSGEGCEEAFLRKSTGRVQIPWTV